MGVHSGGCARVQCLSQHTPLCACLLVGASLSEVPLSYGKLLSGFPKHDIACLLCSPVPLASLRHTSREQRPGVTFVPWLFTNRSGLPAIISWDQEMEVFHELSAGLARWLSG